MVYTQAGCSGYLDKFDIYISFCAHKYKIIVVVLQGRLRINHLECHANQPVQVTETMDHLLARLYEYYGRSSSSATPESAALRRKIRAYIAHLRTLSPHEAVQRTARLEAQLRRAETQFVARAGNIQSEQGSKKRNDVDSQTKNTRPQKQGTPATTAKPQPHPNTPIVDPDIGQELPGTFEVDELKPTGTVSVNEETPSGEPPIQLPMDMIMSILDQYIVDDSGVSGGYRIYKDIRNASTPTYAAMKARVQNVQVDFGPGEWDAWFRRKKLREYYEERLEEWFPKHEHSDPALRANSGVFYVGWNQLPDGPITELEWGFHPYVTDLYGTVLYGADDRRRKCERTIELLRPTIDTIETITLFAPAKARNLYWEDYMADFFPVFRNVRTIRIIADAWWADCTRFVGSMQLSRNFPRLERLYTPRAVVPLDDALSQRIRRLHCAGVCDIEQSMIDPMVLERSMPLLEELRLECGIKAPQLYGIYGSNVSADTTPIFLAKYSIRAENFPALRTLVVDGYDFVVETLGRFKNLERIYGRVAFHRSWCMCETDVRTPCSPRPELHLDFPDFHHYVRAIEKPIYREMQATNLDTYVWGWIESPAVDLTALTTLDASRLFGKYSMAVSQARTPNLKRLRLFSPSDIRIESPSGTLPQVEELYAPITVAVSMIPKLPNLRRVYIIEPKWTRRAGFEVSQLQRQHPGIKFTITNRSGFYGLGPYID